MERETETGSSAQCSTLLCPQSRRPEPEANANTHSPSPNWPASAFPHTGLSAAGLSQHGCLKPHSLTLGERELFLFVHQFSTLAALFPVISASPGQSGSFGMEWTRGSGERNVIQAPGPSRKCLSN